MTRDELDTLIKAACAAVAADVKPTVTGGPDEDQHAAEAAEEAQLLDAEARSFADAVDRDGKRVPYGSAVVLEGTSGVAVVAAADYATAPLYWQTVVGRPDRITQGPELIHVLQAAANRNTPRAT